MEDDRFAILLWPNENQIVLNSAHLRAQRQVEHSLVMESLKNMFLTVLLTANYVVNCKFTKQTLLSNKIT